MTANGLLFTIKPKRMLLNELERNLAMVKRVRLSSNQLRGKLSFKSKDLTWKIPIMKPTENYEQLIERFTKRTTQLSARLAEVKEAHDEYLRIERDLTRLEGSLQAVEYLAFGKLPGDGNHGGMKDHKPQ